MGCEAPRRERTCFLWVKHCCKGSGRDQATYLQTKSRRFFHIFLFRWLRLIVGLSIPIRASRTSISTIPFALAFTTRAASLARAGHCLRPMRPKASSTLVDPGSTPTRAHMPVHRTPPVSQSVSAIRPPLDHGRQAKASHLAPGHEVDALHNGIRLRIVPLSGKPSDQGEAMDCSHVPHRDVYRREG